MSSKRLVIGIVVAAVFGASVTGVYLTVEDFNTPKGYLHITTEKSHYQIGEQIKFHLVNSGNKTVSFADTSYSMTITNTLDQRLYPDAAGEAETTLHPDSEMSFQWTRTDLQGNRVPPGIYKIFSTDYPSAVAIVTIL